MALKKCLKTNESMSKRANDPQSPPSDNVKRCMTIFSNRSIAIERGVGDEVNAFVINILFEEMSWSTIYNMKKAIYPSLIRMFLANMRTTFEPRIMSSLQNKAIEFNCEILANILGISNDGPHVFEMKIIPTIKGFLYDKVEIMHTRGHNFASSVKIKS